MSALALATTLVATAVTWAADLPADKYQEWTQDREIFVPMRDGVHLSTTAVLPKGAAKKLPAILVRAPYDDTSQLFGKWLWLDFFVRQGYAVVEQDERGRGFSEGEYTDYLRGTRTDGADTVAWIVKQPWSNGRVGAIGFSSAGETQWGMAAANPPGLSAIIPGSSWAVGNVPGNATRGAFYRGGVPRLSLWAWWYSFSGPTERLLLPTNSTQEQRIRLRNSFSVKPIWSRNFFVSSDNPNDPGTVDESKLMHLPSQDVVRQFNGALTPFDRYITWTPGDPRWDGVELINAGIKPRVPALHITTWADGATVEVTRLFKYLQDLGTSEQYLIIGPGPHGWYFQEEQFSDLRFGDLDVGDARYRGREHGYQTLFLNWFERWLRGEQNHVTDMPKVQLYVMGQGWISSDEWPPKKIRPTKYYLTHESRSRLTQDTGLLSSTLPSHNMYDSYIYDPSVPSPSLQKSGAGHASGTAAVDQRPVEARRDMFLYSTPPLEKPVTIAGPIEVVLYVSSSARDTDFIVKLIDVYPDGKAINVDDDAFRVRYREGFDKKVLMEPSNVYKITLPNMVTAIRFAKGHRIRLDVSSSDFPAYERNLNTGGNNYDETTWVVAENSIHHGPRYPSHVVLPVLPD